MRYCFEYISKRQAESREAFWNTGATDGLLFHMHELADYGLHAAPKDDYNHIILLRDYNECIRSHAKTRPSLADNVWMDKNLKMYAELIVLHERLCDSKPGHVVYYEEFVQYPRRTLESLIEFVDSISDSLSGQIPSKEHMYDNLDNLMQNIAYHRERCLDAYRGLAPSAAFSSLALSSNRNHSDVGYHSKDLNKHEIDNMRFLIKKTVGPKLYEKYLGIYERVE